ncbi:hypothetical protein DACRYDRAFT_116414 [Dacryopinax primogenitus]|uniref:Uncharacterized protein n=1 Tax=Dacryopinax primogenitus (strain DJM 731) TaxID=1858805 RepID=M5G1F3_DACPD|nr:uncharacterized protein DACRYDRAFT_116414 [Dacryopinax primogenitus]EJU02030.1 hypothetical protein DACRYDRAFT_116414 [Dacryopinax primogenitus]
MGSLCSRPHMPGEGQTLGSGPAPPQRTQPAGPGSRPAPQQQSSPGRTLGSTTHQPAGTPGMSVPSREAAAQAAEARAKAANTRGVNVSNPKAGKLSANLDRQKKDGRMAEEQQPERIIYD